MTNKLYTTNLDRLNELNNVMINLTKDMKVNGENIEIKKIEFNAQYAGLGLGKFDKEFNITNTLIHLNINPKQLKASQLNIIKNKLNKYDYRFGEKISITKNNTKSYKLIVKGKGIKVSDELDFDDYWGESPYGYTFKGIYKDNKIEIKDFEIINNEEVKKDTPLNKQYFNESLKILENISTNFKGDKYLKEVEEINIPKMLNKEYHKIKDFCEELKNEIGLLNYGIKLEMNNVGNCYCLFKMVGYVKSFNENNLEDKVNDILKKYNLYFDVFIKIKEMGYENKVLKIYNDEKEINNLSLEEYTKIYNMLHIYDEILTSTTICDGLITEEPPTIEILFNGEIDKIKDNGRLLLLNKNNNLIVEYCKPYILNQQKFINLIKEIIK